MADEPTQEWGNAPERPQTARVFFALWPDAEVRRRLWREGQKLQRQLGGKLTREESVHMTLLFVGAVPTQHLERLTACASIPFTPFGLAVDTASCWTHNKIAWVAPSVTPMALSQLVAALTLAVRAAGFELERRPFAPHITVVRKARCTPLDPAVPKIEWCVTEYVLVRSELNREGSVYSVIGRWQGSG